MPCPYPLDSNYIFFDTLKAPDTGRYPISNPLSRNQGFFTRGCSARFERASGFLVASCFQRLADNHPKNRNKCSVFPRISCYTVSMDVLSISPPYSGNCQLTTDNFIRRHAPPSPAAANEVGGEVLLRLLHPQPGQRHDRQ